MRSAQAFEKGNNYSYDQWRALVDSAGSAYIVAYGIARTLNAQAADVGSGVHDDPSYPADYALQLYKEYSKNEASFTAAATSAGDVAANGFVPGTDIRIKAHPLYNESYKMNPFAFVAALAARSGYKIRGMINPQDEWVNTRAIASDASIIASEAGTRQKIFDGHLNPWIQRHLAQVEQKAARVDDGAPAAPAADAKVAPIMKIFRSIAIGGVALLFAAAVVATVFALWPALLGIAGGASIATVCAIVGYVGVGLLLLIAIPLASEWQAMRRQAMRQNRLV